MTLLYRPVLISSAEQAEALPVGSYAKNEATTGSGTWYAPPRVNIGRGMWSGDDLYRSSDMVGWTALVRIEAEEEWEDDGRAVWSLSEGEASPADVDDYERRNGRRPSRRLVTHWEDC